MTEKINESKLINGKALAAKIRAEVAEKVSARIVAGQAIPGLATILVGEDPASQVYVKSKHKACEQAGIKSFAFERDADLPQEDLLALIEELNQNSEIHGILVQLPVPKHIDDGLVMETISPAKDVDGLTPKNAGMLAQKGRSPLLAPATPSGIMKLLQSERVKIEGSHAVVLGRSDIVGIPISAMLLKENATVTIGHSRSRDIASICRQADILIAAVGIPEFVKEDWVKEGAVIIDVGVNRVDDSTKKRGYRLVGDVAFDEVIGKVSAITPVPGGVGPMTIAMLMENTLRAAELAD